MGALAMRIGGWMGAVLLISGMTLATARAAESVVTIPTRSGVTETFAFDAPDHPVAATILLPGGDGLVGITDQGGTPSMRHSGNFLVRARGSLMAANLATVVLDVPSDQPDGIDEAFRRSPDHAEDIAAVVAWLRQKTKAPIWLVGTSMGSISAAAGAIALGPRLDGLVLTSSVSTASKHAPAGGVLTLALETIAVPTLVMDHTLDACPSSPPDNAAAIAAHLPHAPRTAVVLINGGQTPTSGPCEPFSYHGYYGAEADAVAAIAGFIKAP